MYEVTLFLCVVVEPYSLLASSFDSAQKWQYVPETQKRYLPAAEFQKKKWYQEDAGGTFKGNKNIERGKELHDIIDKWKALGSTNMTNVSIPELWLLPTTKNNVTFNASLAKNELTKKLASLIQRYNVHDKLKAINQLTVNEAPMNKLLAQQDVKRKSKMEEKAKTILDTVKNKGNKNETKELSEGILEYPGKNQTARSKFLEKWTEYYHCLGNSTELIPKAHYVFPGEVVRMTCQACLRPGGESLIQWMFATVRTKHINEEFDLTRMSSAFTGNNRIALGDRGMSLSIYGVNEKDAGNYSCKQFDTLLTVHLLQVADPAENITKVWPDRFQGKIHSAPEITLPNFGLTVFTKWKNWTSCSRCEHVGKRFRIGICTVGKARNASKNAPEVLTLFKDGIPCNSKLLPKSISDHPNVRSRNSEIMEAFCKEPCPKEGKFVVRNEKGQIVEEADNAKGVYSMLQKLPKLPPPIKRKIIFLKQWDNAYIQCPGNILDDVPPRWFINEQPIYARGDRIYVTPSHTLIVEDLGLSDSNLYSCWQGSKLVGTVRLIVTQPIRLSVSQQISAVSMILIVSTFILMFGRAFCKALQKQQG